jgi:WD40 repeat protein
MNYSDPVLCVDCSPDNKYIASGCEDGRIKIWDIEKGTFINKLMFHEFSIKNICYSPNGRQIISCADRFYIKIWNAETYDLIRTLNNAPQCISKICYSPNGIHIIAASDNYINIWDVTTGILITNVYAVVNIKSICCSCDNKYIISGHVDGIIKIWGTDKLFPISTIKEHLAMITDLCCSSDNKYFVSTSNDNIINLWDIETHKPIKTFLSNNPQHICFSPDNKCIISSNKKGNIDVWDIETGIVINNFNAESVSNIRCIDNRDDILEQRIIASLKEN